MKNKNFDSISKFSVPQSWIDGAKSVPVRSKTKKPIPFYIRYKNYIATAAMLVLVVSLSIFILMINKTKPPVVSTNNGTVVKPTTSTEYVTDVEGNTIYIPSDTTEIETTTNGNIIIKPSENGNEKPINPSEKPTQNSTDADEKPTDDSTKEPIVVPPTSTPLNPSVQPSSEEPSSDNPPPDDPSTPEYPPFEEPSAEEPSTDVEEPSIPQNPQERVVATVSISKKLLEGISDVYCKVYDSKGNLCGDPNLYSAQHKVILIPRTDGKMTLYYEIDRSLLGTGSSFRFVYYDSSGNTLAKTTDYDVY